MNVAALVRMLPQRVQNALGGEEGLAVIVPSMWGFTVRAAGVFLMTIVTILFTRLMGAEEYGRLAFLLSGSFIIVLFAGLGLPTASSRLLPRYLARGRNRTAAHYVVMGLASCGLMAILAGALLVVLMRALPAVFAEYHFSALAIIGLVVTISLMRFASEGSRALGLQLTGFFAESVAVRLILLIALWLMLATGMALSADHALLLYVAAQAVVVAAVAWLMLKRSHPSLDALRLRPLKLYRGWLGTSLVMLVTPVYYFLLFETDVVVLGILAGPYDVGLYQVARRVAELSVFCAGAASAVGLPRLARAHAERDNARLQATVDVMNLIAVSTTGAIVLGLVAVGPFALWLFGPEFQAGYPALVILAVARLLATFFGPVSDLLLMTGHHGRLGRINAAFAVVNIALNLALIPWLGALGAAIATAVASVGWTAWLYLVAHRLTPIETSALRRFLGRGGAATTGVSP